MSNICADCGFDTTPCTHKPGCRHRGRWEHYMVSDEVWESAGTWNAHGGRIDFLCVGCLEKRLGRTLTPADFTDCPINQPDSWDTPRLAARKAGIAR